MIEIFVCGRRPYGAWQVTGGHCQSPITAIWSTCLYMNRMSRCVQ